MSKTAILYGVKIRQMFNFAVALQGIEVVKTFERKPVALYGVYERPL